MFWQDGADPKTLNRDGYSLPSALRPLCLRNIDTNIIAGALAHAIAPAVCDWMDPAQAAAPGRNGVSNHVRLDARARAVALLPGAADLLPCTVLLDFKGAFPVYADRY